MLIDFSLRDFEITMPKDIGYMKSRTCEHNSDIFKYINSIKDLDDPYVKSHIKNIKDNLNKQKNYSFLAVSKNKNNFIEGIYKDNKYDIELTGYTNTSWDTSVEISLEHSLDYILFFICGSDICKVRQMKDYFKISKAILKINYSELEQITLQNFIGLDNNLDLYISKVIEEEVQYSKVIERIFTDILEKASTLINNIVLGLRFQLNSNTNTKGSLVIRSRDYCSYVVNFKGDFEKIQIATAMKYNLIPRFYKKGEYINCINSICSEVL